MRSSHSNWVLRLNSIQKNLPIQIRHQGLTPCCLLCFGRGKEKPWVQYTGSKWLFIISKQLFIKQIKYSENTWKELERFSIECHKNLNQNRSNHSSQSRTADTDNTVNQSKLEVITGYKWLMWSTIKHVRVSHDWFWFYFWLDYKVARVL